MRKAGNRVRITGQLVDTSTGAHIWADHFDGALHDIFELQDRLASSVVGAIAPRLRQSEIDRARRKPTQSVDAYDLFLRALGQLHHMGKNSWSEAIRFAQQALEIDPFYGPAAALAAYTHVVQITQGWAEPEDERRLTETAKLARLALAYGKEDSFAVSAAVFAIAYCGDMLVAETAADRAVFLNPNDSGAWSVRGWIHCFLNRPKAAADAFERARRLNPFGPFGAYFSFGMGVAAFEEGKYEEALEWGDRALGEEGAFVGPLLLKLTLCGLLGKRGEVHHSLKRLLELDSGFTVTSFERFYSRLFVPEVVALRVEGLRKAGLPEACPTQHRVPTISGPRR